MISLTPVLDGEISGNPLMAWANLICLIIVKEWLIFFKPNIYLTLCQLKSNLDNFTGNQECITFVLLKDNNNDSERVHENSCQI